MSERSGSARALKGADVDVLVVNYLTPDLTHQAVRALSSSGAAFFVRDNSGDLDSKQLRTESPSTTVVSDGTNNYYARGNNDLYVRGSRPLVLLLNPDVVLRPASLATLINELSKDDDLWAVVPQLLNEDGTFQPYYRRLPTLLTIICDRLPPLRRLFRDAWARHMYADLVAGQRFSPEAPPAACMLLRRECVGSLLFDENLTLFYNDTDLCLRMRAAGRRLDLIPEAPAVHLRGASLARLRSTDRFAVAAIYDKDCLAYARKNLRGWRAVQVAVLLRRAGQFFLERLSGTKRLERRSHV